MIFNLVTQEQLKSIKNVLSLTTGKVIEENADLDSYIKAGTYTCTKKAIASTVINSPYTVGNFKLIININTTMNDNACWGTQTIIAGNENRIFTRGIYMDSSNTVVNFTDWKEIGQKQPFELAIDSKGNYGYKKNGADTVTKFGHEMVWDASTATLKIIL